jgi:catechol 2,3-dioxygenase
MPRFSWIQTPFNILRAAHAELMVTDLAQAEEFYVGTLGFVVTEQVAGCLYLRGYEERLHHCLVIRQGTTPCLGHLSFRVASEEDLDRLAHHFGTAGIATHWTTDAEPGQGRALRLQDPLGFPVEFFFAMDQVERLLQRFDLYRGAEVMRLDHFNLQVPNVASAFEYYRSLGFRCSEYVSTDPPDERIVAAWMFRKPSVHDVALTGGRGPRLHHIGFWVSETGSVFRACDILAARGKVKAMERGPARHGISNAFFLYLRDPDGHRIELYTSEYYVGDPDFEPIRWSVADEQRATFWGQPVPASWHEEASLVASYSGGTVPLAEKVR